MLVIGIDVGGTNTDAVLMDGSNLLAQAKSPTTPDVTSGIISSIDQVVKHRAPGSELRGVMLGTTHFINALLERQRLSRTAILRLALPATRLLPPFVDWPEALQEAIGGLTYMVHGGHEFDGREISPLDEKELRATAQQMKADGVQAVAVCGVFSPVNPTHEQEAAAIIQQETPQLRLTLSHENGRVGLLERENASALNASLMDLAVTTIEAIKGALASLGLDTPLFLSQNDGTLMDADFAVRFPVYTIASGPTNSMRGAAFLSGIRNGIVVDVGGSSTDVGALVNGFPLESSVSVKIAGVRTNFRMPDVFSSALGGGSRVEQEPLRIGPESVGYRLTEEALIFGGNTLTTTDIAVAAGRSDLGQKDRVSALDRILIEQVDREIQHRVETFVDQVKLSAAPVPVVLVGGGNILVDDTIPGVSEVIRPPHSEVANAIGAAIAQVSGQIEKVLAVDAAGPDSLEDVKAEAIDRAVAAGANPGTVEIVEMDQIPLTYLPGKATLVRVKAVGDLLEL